LFKALLPHEWLALVVGAAAWATLRLLPVHYAADRAALKLAATLAVPLIIVLAAVVLGRGVMILTRKWFWKTGTPQVRHVLPTSCRQPLWLRDTAGAYLALWIVLTAHFLIKSSIHLINPLVFDKWLWLYDRWLGFGHDPVLILLHILHFPWLLHGIDLVYSVLYPAVWALYPPVFWLVLRTRRERLSFMLAFTLLWVAGLALYLLLPSWGPVFTRPDYFETTLKYMPATVHVQRVLYEGLKALVEHPYGPRTIRYGGVAAFPSLHLAVVTLFAAASRKVSRTWFSANLALAGIMFVGSMLTGYHYLFDSLAGVLMGWLCFRLAFRWIAFHLPIRAGG
jgi:hypothetical protein